MSYGPQKLGTITIDVMGIEVTVKGAVFYPHVPETQIDPSEAAFAEWDAVFVGKEEITELFCYEPNTDRLHEAILQAVE